MAIRAPALKLATEAMSDRALQDRLIRYLTDAGERVLGPQSLPLSGNDVARAGRFANFLARHFYRDRLARSFQYSREFREQTGRSAEHVVESAEFDAFLTRCTLGSLQSAQRVGWMAHAYMAAGTDVAPWWANVIDYEYAYFLQAATSEGPPASPFPIRGRSAVLKQFEWSMPEMIARLRAGSGPQKKMSPELAVSDRRVATWDDLRREVMLLFSRTGEGKLFVVEIEKPLAAVFNAIDGSTEAVDIASKAGVSYGETQQVIAALADIGAVVLPAQK